MATTAVGRVDHKAGDAPLGRPAPALVPEPTVAIAFDQVGVVQVLGRPFFGLAFGRVIEIGKGLQRRGGIELSHFVGLSSGVGINWGITVGPLQPRRSPGLIDVMLLAGVARLRSLAVADHSMTPGGFDGESSL